MGLSKNRYISNLDGIVSIIVVISNMTISLTIIIIIIIIMLFIIVENNLGGTIPHPVTHREKIIGYIILYPLCIHIISPILQILLVCTITCLGFITVFDAFGGQNQDQWGPSSHGTASAFLRPYIWRESWRNSPLGCSGASRNSPAGDVRGMMTSLQ